MKRQETRGSRAFKAAPGSPADKAARLDVSVDAVRSWYRGDRQPGEDMQHTIEAEYGVPWLWWREPASEPEAAAAPVAPAQPATPEGIVAMAQAMMGDAADARAAATLMADPAARIRALGQAADIVKTLATICGTLQSERQVIDNPHFRRIVDRLLEAVQPFKEAHAAIVAALAPRDDDE